MPHPQPFTPEGAPPRPVWSQIWKPTLLGLIFLAINFSNLDHMFSRNLAIFITVPLSMLGIILVASLCHGYNTSGWYELKPIKMPDLPFKNSIDCTPIVFTQTYITFNSEKVVYQEIAIVRTLCRGVYFSGVEVCLGNGKRHLIHNYYSDGEPARTALAILRHQAPQARFEGPPWVEQGWVPRLGFTYPSDGG